jgi:hypothetical protein
MPADESGRTPTEKPRSLHNRVQISTTDAAEGDFHEHIVGIVECRDRKGFDRYGPFPSVYGDVHCGIL